MLKPLLSRHYSIWVDPPDESGDEVMYVVSEHRSLKLKGVSFREFRDRVLPLLDGAHTVDVIAAATDDVFSRDDLMSSLAVLEEHGVVVDAADQSAEDAAAARLAPQLNLFRELAPGDRPQDRLRTKTLTVVGLGGAGSSVALAVAAAGVGTVRCVDGLTVTAADTYLAPAFGAGAVGRPRGEVTLELITAAAPDTRAVAVGGAVDAEGDLAQLISGSDLVVCCLDAAQLNTIYKLNRVCLAGGLPWLFASPAGPEISVGPLFIPGRTACFTCYRMRTIACAGNPDDAYKYERELDRRRRDDSAQRAGMGTGAGLVANFAALEAVKVLSGVAESPLVGRLLTIRLTDLATELHTVLQKPWCPECFEKGSGP
jgi:molybdopterin-synthase adenylyltransferase